MRSLPSRRNPLTAPGEAPSYDDLLTRRRLGKTKLSVKPGQVGTSNATKAEHLGPVEYAHLRAPLPEDLSGSEIFASQPGQPHPETYFLMRRSKDGYVSATGMFKIAFPWAQLAEERSEREYLKTLRSTSEDEIAGNVWITPEAALDLAAEYGLQQWILALLDPLEIAQSPASTKKQITAPPKFEVPSKLKDLKLSPPATIGKGTRGRRSMSPVKATPSKIKASPRKRQTKKEKEASIAHANAASASLQSALDDAASVADATPAPESPGLSSAHGDSKVRVEVDQAVEINGNTEVTHTNVTVEMPAGLPELPLPEDTEAMLDKARQMVEEAKALDPEGTSSPKAARKRKVEEVEPSDVDAELPVQPAKRARVLEEKYKRERVRTRAVFGVAASLAVAAAIPFFQSFF